MTYAVRIILLDSEMDLRSRWAGWHTDTRFHNGYRVKFDKNTASR
jgi:hypothetical protein